jgi:phosphoenolpyruvate synthase/pyruvate phosphate dikinase
VDEDGISASFAGQHETLLNIAGVEAVAQAAVQCWQWMLNCAYAAGRLYLLQCRPITALSRE